MGRKSRDQKTAQALERIIDVVGNRLTDEQQALELQDTVRQNRKISLEEQRTAMQIKESRHRISTNEQMLAVLNDEVLKGAFVRKSDIRDELRRGLSSLSLLSSDDIETFVMRLLPESKDEVDDLNSTIVEAWARMHGKKSG